MILLPAKTKTYIRKKIYQIVNKKPNILETGSIMKLV